MSALTPLCPAGHLPLKGGDRQLWPRRPFCSGGDWRNQSRRQISPLEGEMSGRTEGGLSAEVVRSVCHTGMLDTHRTVARLTPRSIHAICAASGKDAGQ
ncbi:MAG: hypothetical protein E5Y77_14800 [Mesorhizobium sp.]|nr:MAG: hypothetical protein E5Y77_14800 [Mesorhizobium sp.]